MTGSHEDMPVMRGKAAPSPSPPPPSGCPRSAWLSGQPAASGGRSASESPRRSSRFTWVSAPCSSESARSTASAEWPVRPRRAVAIAGLVLGLASPVIYAKQSVDFRRAMEQTETENLASIAAAIRAYAAANTGNFPADLETLVRADTRRETLQSPFSAEPDYVYDGKDLTQAVVGERPSAFIVVHGKDLRRGKGAVGFADGPRCLPPRRGPRKGLGRQQRRPAKGWPRGAQGDEAGGRWFT